MPQQPSVGRRKLPCRLGGLWMLGGRRHQHKWPPNLLLQFLRGNHANPALLRCATTGRPVVHSSQIRLTAIRGHVITCQWQSVDSGSFW